MNANNVKKNSPQGSATTAASASVVEIVRSVLNTYPTSDHLASFAEADIGNLVLTFSPRESICIAGLVVIDYVEKNGSNQVRIAIRGPKCIPIVRIKKEIDDATNG